MFTDGDNTVFPSNVMDVPPPTVALKPPQDHRHSLHFILFSHNIMSYMFFYRNLIELFVVWTRRRWTRPCTTTWWRGSRRPTPPVPPSRPSPTSYDPPFSSFYTLSISFTTFFRLNLSNISLWRGYYFFILFSVSLLPSLWTPYLWFVSFRLFRLFFPPFFSFSLRC